MCGECRAYRRLHDYILHHYVVKIIAVLRFFKVKLQNNVVIFVLQNVAKTPGVYKKAQGHSAGATKTFDIKNM